MKHLIIGGAGFIGSNLASHLIDSGEEVILLDDLSRRGTRSNLEWIMNKGKNVKFIRCDISKDIAKVYETIKGVDVIYHLAAQVAVTSSVEDPRRDFEINALGTFNILEGVRLYCPDAIFIYASTNKVYGGMESVRVKELATRYTYQDYELGITETFPLDFHSPYGCSKGTGDQYVRDYSRIYGLNTVVFRKSCIYGPRQFGVEDQGWLAWFIIALLMGKNITIYGDGKQVRDVLYIDDLVLAYEKAVSGINRVKGKIFNIGGGTQNSISVWYELQPILERLFQKNINVAFSDWRPGDQKIFVSDISYAGKELTWEPTVSPKHGIEKLYNWACNNKNLFQV